MLPNYLGVSFGSYSVVAVTRGDSASKKLIRFVARANTHPVAELSSKRSEAVDFGSENPLRRRSDVQPSVLLPEVEYGLNCFR